MRFINLIKIGFGATSWMTLYMNLASKVSKDQLKVIRILGSLATNETFLGKTKSTPKVKIVGTTLHYAVGMMFVYAYHLLWSNGITKPTFKIGSTIGLVSGLFGITVWELFMKIHPHPPKISRKIYFTNLIVAHIIFGIAAQYYYKKITVDQ